MTTNYEFSTWKFKAQNMLRTCCVHKLFWISKQKPICVHKIISTCFKVGIFMYWNCNSMNNLLSYCGLVDTRISASEKDSPVQKTIKGSGINKKSIHVEWEIKISKTTAFFVEIFHTSLTLLSNIRFFAKFGCLFRISELKLSALKTLSKGSLSKLLLRQDAFPASPKVLKIVIILGTR